ncbi:MAG: restriction endonuclease subunit S [Bacteroidales bacterium]|nr:restriction endonuclease subunit S [Candidatus Cacconaster merdequi]
MSTPSKYKMLSSKNVNFDTIVDVEECRYLSHDDWVMCNSRTNLQKGDILLTTVATLGRSCVVETTEQFCFQRSVTILTTLIFNKYLKYVFDSDFYQEIMSDGAKGTAQKGFYLNQVEQSFIPVPPLAEQKQIVKEIDNWLSILDFVEKEKNVLMDAISATKSKTLDLAIHGKLVPQDPSDEPASELLKRINPKAVISCDNPQYGKIPSSWVITTVGEVFEINPKTHSKDDTEAAFVPMTCVSDGYCNTFEYECRKWGDIKKGFVHFQDNDVAVAKISPCLENRKSVVFHNLPNGIGAGTTELNVFRCKEILPDYSLLYFKSQMFIGSCAGTYNGVVGQQRVAKSFIQELPIGVPPYNEQLRIVSKVNDIFSQLEMIEKSLQA